MKQKLSKSELIDKLNSQISKLEKFNLIFDNGDFSIAQEIAVKLRIIFHNSENSKSLLRLLKLEHIMFIDTGDKFNVHNPLSHWGLLAMVLRGKKSNENSGMIPKLRNTKFQYVNFQNWWENKKVLKGLNQKAYTRRTLVQFLANKDGGAHVDNEIDIEDYEMSRKNNIGWSLFNSKGEKIPLNDPILPSVRQISYETLETFKNISIERKQIEIIDYFSKISTNSSSNPKELS